MKLLARGRMRWAFALISLVGVVVSWIALTERARAQNFPGPWNNLTAGGIVPLPPPPPQGAYGGVIFANAKWLVVQNEEGQQFPVAADSIRQFLVRWPATLTDLTVPGILVEGMGPDLGGMMIQTDHIDLFTGAAQALVQPGYTSVLPINRPVTAIDPTYQRWMSAYDIAEQNTLYSWVYPTLPGDNGIPGQMHVVGNPLGLNPLRLGVPGNNIVTVLPPNPGVMSITQVTTGTTAMGKKGDTAFLTPVQGQNAMSEKSLILQQLVLYKKVRRDDFVP